MITSARIQDDLRLAEPYVSVPTLTGVVVECQIGIGPHTSRSRWDGDRNIVGEGAAGADLTCSGQ